MNTSTWARAVLVAAILAGTAAAAPDEDGPNAEGLGFLEAGKDYVIRFPEQDNIFKVAQSEITEATYTDGDGTTKSAGPVTWNFTLSISVFQVVRFGGGSWVLLRHPTSSDDFLKWAKQRQAKAILAGPHAEAIGAEPDGQERLKALREAADAEVPTSETWVNLDHAIAIAPVPTEEFKPKLSVKAIRVEPKD